MLKNAIKSISKRIEKRSLFNLVTGFSYQIISISMGLILPYLFITSLGSESNGLLSSTGQVFACLGLLEAGVGMTTLQALYKPIADNDRNEINAILSATNIYYKKTGTWYLLAVLVLIVVYPYVVDSNIAPGTIRLVIALQGGGTVISFLFQAKYNILLKAEGKNYIISLLSLALLLFRNIGKILAIQWGYNIVAVQEIQFITIIIEATVIVLYIKKKYPWISMKSIPDFNAISQKGTVFVQSIAWMIFNHTDILVLTIFTRSLGIVSVYSVYALLFEAAQNFLNQIRDSFQYKIGRIAHTNKEQLDDYFEEYSTKILVITFAIYSALYLVSVPFISLYTKGVTDADYYAKLVPELFFAYKVLYGVRVLNKQLIEGNGHFKQTNYIPIAETCLNMIFSVVFVIPFKVQGVLIGSVVSSSVSVCLYIAYLYRNVARKAIKTQLLQILISIPLFIGILVIGLNRWISVNSWITLVWKSVFIGITCLALYYTCLKISSIIKRMYSNIL